MAIAVPYWVSQAKGETGKAWCTQIRPHYGVGAAGWMSDLNGRAQPVTVAIHNSFFQNGSGEGGTNGKGYYIDVEASNAGSGRYFSAHIEVLAADRARLYEGVISGNADGNGYISRRRVGRIYLDNCSHESFNGHWTYHRGYVTIRMRVASADGINFYSGQIRLSA